MSTENPLNLKQKAWGGKQDELKASLQELY